MRVSVVCASVVCASALVANGCIEEASRESLWSCLAHGRAAARDEPVAVRLTLLDEANDRPIMGVVVRQCLRGDLACESPIATVTSDAEGAVALALVDEYVELQANGYRRTIAMGLSSFELERATESMLDMHFDLYSDSSFESLRQASDVVRVSERADVEVLVRDCSYETAAGAEVELDSSDPLTIRRYLVNDLPSITARETDIDSGSVLFFNVPPGLRSLAPSLVRSGRSATGDATPLSAITRPGWLTQVTSLPVALDILTLEP